MLWQSSSSEDTGTLNGQDPFESWSRHCFMKPLQDTHSCYVIDNIF